MIEENSNQEEKIVESLVSKLKRNAYLKSLVKRLENYDYDHITHNSDDGVDWQVNFDIKKLKLDLIPENYIREALELHFDGASVYLNIKEGYLYQSSCDEIFVNTHDNTVHLGDMDFPKYQDDFHLWLLIEDKMETSGYFPGIYTTDYYGNVGEHKFDEDYKTYFAEDETQKKRDQIREYLSYYAIKEGLDEGTRYDLTSVNDKFWDLLSKEVKDYQFNSWVNLYSIESISPKSLVFRIEVGDKELKNTVSKLVDAKYGIYEIEISLISNALHFILTDDKISGGTYGFDLSLLSV